MSFLKFIKDRHRKTNQFILHMELLHLENFSVHQTKQLSLLNELTRLCLHALSFSVSAVKWSASSRLSPSLYCPKRISGQMTIVKTRPTLFYRRFIIRYSVGVSIVQGFVFNKMELEGVVMLVFIIVSVLLLIIPSIMISRQPQSSAALSFSVS